MTRSLALKLLAALALVGGLGLVLDVTSDYQTQVHAAWDTGRGAIQRRSRLLVGLLQPLAPEFNDEGSQCRAVLTRAIELAIVNGGLGEVLLLDGQGNVLAGQCSGCGPLLPKLLTQAAAPHAANVVLYNDVARNQVLSVTRVEMADPAGAQNLFIHLSFDVRPQLHEVREHLVERLAMILLSSAMLTLVLYGLLYALVIRPTRSLVTAAQRLAEGDLGARSAIPVPLDGGDELQQLAQAFDHLAVRIESETLAQRRVTHSLQESEARFRRLMENAADVIFSIHLPTGQFEYISPALFTLAGVLPAQLQAQPRLVWRLLHPASRRAVHGYWRRLRQGRLDPAWEYQVIRPRGAVRHIHQRNVLVYDEQRRPLRLEAIASDVTDWKSAEQSASQRLDELAHMARVSTVNELASGLAHELNQPLACIANYTAAALAEVRDGQLQRGPLLDTLEDINQQVRRAGEVLRRVRNFLRPAQRQRRRVDLTQLIRNTALVLTSYAHSHGVEVQLELHQAPPLVDVDPVLIEQVLLNLLRNAIEASAEGTPAERRVRLNAHVDGAGSAVVRICDSGPGLTPQMRAHLFEPFVSGRRGGLGLGLSIARTIVENHGGRIWHEAAPAGGAIFCFSLPLVTAEPTP